MKKKGFLFQVNMLKWEKLINAKAITSLLHYRGLYCSDIAEEYISLLRETKKKNFGIPYFSFSRATILMFDVLVPVQ